MNKKNEVKRKNEKVINNWFEKGTDKDCDMRILLWKLLQECLGMNSYNSSIPWNQWTDNRSKPFSNKFKEEKRTQNVFTNTVLADFILLCIKEKGENRIDSYFLEKAVSIIRNSKYLCGREEYRLGKDSSKISLQCTNDNEIKECYNGMKDKRRFIYDRCENCTVAWIFRNLQYIEKNYYSIISYKNILSQYPEEKQKLTVEKIYKKIMEYEKLPLKKQCDLKELFSLFNTCIEGYNISDVADKKVAYIKWYTAHLFNWPFFKSCLLYVNHYDEFTVYQMLRSASDILQAIESDDEELLAAVECDRVISFLSLGYLNPFLLYYCGNPDDIEKSCFRVLQKIKNPCYQYRIWLLLWKLHSHLHKDDLSKYEKEINAIYSENQDNPKIAVLNAEYMLYRYHYDIGNRNDVKEKIIALAKNFIGKKNIPESLEIISELFFTYDEKASPEEHRKENPLALYLELKGWGDFTSGSFIFPDKPSKSRRIFSEYTLFQSPGATFFVESYYEKRRKEIMEYYGLWERTSKECPKRIDG